MVDASKYCYIHKHCTYIQVPGIIRYQTLCEKPTKVCYTNIVSQLKHGNEKKHTGSRHERSFEMRDLVVQHISFE